jgi:hypothetical protein
MMAFVAAVNDRAGAEYADDASASGEEEWQATASPTASARAAAAPKKSAAGKRKKGPASSPAAATQPRKRGGGKAKLPPSPESSAGGPGDDDGIMVDEASSSHGGAGAALGTDGPSGAGGGSAAERFTQEDAFFADVLELHTVKDADGRPVVHHVPVAQLTLSELGRPLRKNSDEMSKLMDSIRKHGFADGMGWIRVYRAPGESLFTVLDGNHRVFALQQLAARAGSDEERARFMSVPVRELANLTQDQLSILAQRESYSHGVASVLQQATQQLYQDMC